MGGLDCSAAQIFLLASKASKLHLAGRIRLSTAAPAEAPLLAAMETLFNTATADRVDGRSVDTFPLSERLRELHDVILAILREFVTESVMDPVYALSLTKCVLLVLVLMHPGIAERTRTLRSPILSSPPLSLPSLPFVSLVPLPLLWV